MNSMDDLDLLRKFTSEHSQEAFATLVHRHLDLVYSASLRQVRSPQLAEEVAQSVFTDLALNAAKLKPNTVLTAWLYEVTRRTAINVIRSEARRQLREHLAQDLNAMNEPEGNWSQIEPLLDEAMLTLDDIDRTAVLLRYFENKSLREVGQSLGTTDDTARKRVNRAVDRLREFLLRHGVVVGTSGLVVAISANAVQAAPLGLSVTLGSAAALAKAGFSSAAAATTTKTAIMTTVQKAVFASVLVVAVGTGGYQLYQNSVLRDQDSKRAGQLDQARMDLENAQQQLTASRSENEDLARDTQELSKLRGELNQLRRQNEYAAQRPAGGVRPAERPPQELNRAWVQQILEGPLQDQGAAAGRLRGKLLRSDTGDISPSELDLQKALLERGLNESLERSPGDFAEFQSAFIEATVGITDAATVQHVRNLIQTTYETAVAEGLDIPSKPANDPESWVQRRHQLDRQATEQLKQLLTPDQQALFDRAFLGLMGVDLGGVGVDRSNYPVGFLGPE
jgi:RNA polymerase sigma factor (sigma-70 family)